MPLYRHADKIVLFVHIPKTGGSTVEEVLNAAGAAQALKYHKKLGFSRATPQHMAWDVTRHWMPRSFYDYSFAVVREPVARLVSEYRWRGTLQEAPLPAFDLWVNDILDRYPSHTYMLDNHIRPQAEFVAPHVQIFRLEDGLQAPITAGLHALGLADREITIHHARRSQQDTLAVRAATLDRIRAFYAGDFKAFGYKPDGALPKGLVLSEESSPKILD